MYKQIAKVYSDCFDRYGPTCKGLDWPCEEEVFLRYEAIASIIAPGASVLDFGCGYAGLLDFFIDCGRPVNYTGLDINSNYIDYCRSKHASTTFLIQDVMENDLVDDYDYIVLNGVLTARYSVSHESMLEFARDLLERCFLHCNQGLAVNFTSPYSNKHKDKLFCPTLDEVGSIACGLTSVFQINHSYLPFEQMLYLYK